MPRPRWDSHRAEPAGSLTQVGVDAPEDVNSGQQVLGRLDDDAVVGVDDVGDRHLRDLGAQLVGVHDVQPVQEADPVDELGVR